MDKRGSTPPVPVPTMPELVGISSLNQIDSLRLCAADAAHVRVLAELGTDLPPILVNRRTMRVVDGWHRVLAAKLRGESEIQAQFLDCDDDEAFVLAVQANIAHGLPLTLAERTAAAKRIMLANPQWSDRAIASVTGLAHKTVGAIRRRDRDQLPSADTREGRDGRVRPRDGANGRLAAAELLETRPSASLREIAREVGISPATVRDVRLRLEQGEHPVPGTSSSGCPVVRTAQHAHRTESSVRQLFPLVSSSVPAVSAVLGNLREDPSLRLTERGRLLLRLLEASAIVQREGQRLSDAVPAHRADVVVMVARSCGQAWQAFASELEQRGQREQSSG